MTRSVVWQVVLLLLAGACEAAPGGGDASVPARCVDRWTLELEGATVEDLVPVEGAWVAVGRAAGDGWLGAIEPCEGTRSREARVAGASLTAATRLGPDVYAVGAIGDDGVLVRADRALELAYAAPLGDPGATESLLDVATAGGALYAVGGLSVVRIDADGTACPLGLPPGANGRAVHAEGDGIYVAASELDAVRIHRFSAAACARDGCACVPADSTPPLDLGVAAPTVAALAVEGGRAWLVGYAIEGSGRGAAFLARVELASGALEAVSRIDPTPGVDGFVDLALEEELVLAVGATGWDGAPGFASAAGVLAAFDRDFATDAGPIVVLEPSGVRLATAVALDPTGPRFFLAGLAGDAGSRVLMCTRSATGCEATITGEWPGGSSDGGVAPPLDAGLPADAGTPPPSRAPAIDPRDGRRFVRGGAPWYPTGYYPGAALNMTGPDFGGDFAAYNDALIDRLASEQIDLFRVWIHWGALTYAPASGEPSWDAHVRTPYARTGPGDAIDGLPRLDLDAWDEAYFAELERAVSRAEAADIVVQVLLLDCWHAGFGRSVGFEAYDVFAAGNNVNGVSFGSEAEWADVDGPVYARNTAFVEEVVRRIGHHENVIWETCNEPRWIPPEDPVAVAAHPFHARLADRIHAIEAALGHPRHLVMPVDLPEHRSVAGHRTPAGSMAESVDDFRRALVGGQHAWGVPLISDNDCCPGEPPAELLRRKAWAALTGGAHLDVFNNEMFSRSVLESSNTTLGMRWVSMPGRLVRARGIDLASMTPCDATATPPRWCYGHAGGERVLYVEGGGATTLSGLAVPADAVWFDPRTGATTDAGGGPTFTAPDGGDWALHVR